MCLVFFFNLFCLSSFRNRSACTRRVSLCTSHGANTTASSEVSLRLERAALSSRMGAVVRKSATTTGLIAPSVWVGKTSGEVASCAFAHRILRNSKVLHKLLGDLVMIACGKVSRGAGMSSAHFANPSSDDAWAQALARQETSGYQSVSLLLIFFSLSLRRFPNMSNLTNDVMSCQSCYRTDFQDSHVEL